MSLLDRIKQAKSSVDDAGFEVSALRARLRGKDLVDNDMLRMSEFIADQLHSAASMLTVAFREVQDLQASSEGGY